MKPIIGVLGAGRMATALAERLLSLGFPVQVWNRTAQKTDSLCTKGAVRCETPAELSQNASYIFSFLADDEASERAWLAPDGASRHLAPGKFAIECSTLSYGFVTRLSQAIEKTGAIYIDAPVTSVPEQILRGETIFLIGSSKPSLDLVMPVLKEIGQEFHHFGPAGAGTVYKLMNNLVGAVHIAAAAELLKLTQKAGLESNEVVNTFLSGPLRSGPAALVLQNMIENCHNHNVHFTTALRAKDSFYALKMAQDFGLDLPVGKAAWTIFDRAARHEAGNLGQSAIIDFIEDTLHEEP